MFTEKLHQHKTADVATHTEACLPFGSKINIEQIQYDTGGGATNSAATFARLGKFKVAALTSIGADSRGQSVIKALKADNINTALIQTSNRYNTAYSVIISPARSQGERTILAYRGASKEFNHHKISWRKLRAKAFYVSSLGGDIALLKKILAHAKKIGAQVAWNPGGQEIGRIKNYGLRIKNLVDFLILNREEAAALTGEKFENTKGLLRALARFAPSAIMTDGPKGAYAVVGKEHRAKSEEQKLYALRPKPYAAFYVPSVGHQPKNLTGAGDAFGSGFLTGWIKSHGDIKYALRLASFNADSVVQHVGAKNGILEKIPSAKQMQKLPVREMRLDK